MQQQLGFCQFSAQYGIVQRAEEDVLTYVKAAAARLLPVKCNIRDIPTIAKEGEGVLH